MRRAMMDPSRRAPSDPEVPPVDEERDERASEILSAGTAVVGAAG
jgi:hypothetical protein